MPMDQSFIGRTYPPTEPYQVGREKIREFADAIGAPDALYHDVAAAHAAGYRDVVAPPTFPIILSFAAMEQIVTDPELGMDYTRVVHGDQRFSYRRPIVAGDELVVVSSIDDITNRGGHDFLTTRAELSTPAGEPVVTVVCKLVVRGHGE
ncbi:MaoC family dehydratase N-terminal domain-containing protein [Catellatospora tritici]|uniref:MaoC family dehydratase N-terminal domain-containing protein n=1 Tax=Catellatospora tritici TaxID=2851566 RepID=UPI001C2D6071|nr:MaoC family dehydratase N-terminal domain-containing protein [Catellatospora tritici]MBV1849828.1 MaoC family dehydratase N-terminal domain-containing protein [Catellatospora tritici]